MEHTNIPDEQNDSEIVEVDFIDVPLMDASTLLPFPEESYHQELLREPVPLSHRIAHLIPFVEVTSNKHTTGSIASGLGVEDSWVKAVAKRMGIDTTAEVDIHGEIHDIYPSLSYELIEEELGWLRAYETLDSVISSHTIGKFLARHPDWVETTALELGVYHTPRTRLASGFEGYGYPKDLVLKLRHLMLVIPPAEDRLTVDALAQMTGRKKSWIQSQLEKKGIESDSRRSIISGSIARHYPWESYEIITKIIDQEPVPAGDWLTVNAMASKLGKDYEWVKKRIAEYFAESGELRLDDNHRSVIHYPPQVFEALSKMLDEVLSYEYAEITDLALSALAKRVGHDQKWISARLPYTTIVPRTKLNPANNKPISYYAEQDVNVLLELPADILKQPKK